MQCCKLIVLFPAVPTAANTALFPPNYTPEDVVREILDHIIADYKLDPEGYRPTMLALAVTSRVCRSAVLPIVARTVTLHSARNVAIIPGLGEESAAFDWGPLGPRMQIMLCIRQLSIDHLPPWDIFIRSLHALAPLLEVFAVRETHQLQLVPLLAGAHSPTFPRLHSLSFIAPSPVSMPPIAGRTTPRPRIFLVSQVILWLQALSSSQVPVLNTLLLYGISPADVPAWTSSPIHTLVFVWLESNAAQDYVAMPIWTAAYPSVRRALFVYPWHAHASQLRYPSAPEEIIWVYNSHPFGMDKFDRRVQAALRPQLTLESLHVVGVPPVRMIKWWADEVASGRAWHLKGEVWPGADSEN